MAPDPRSLSEIESIDQGLMAAEDAVRESRDLAMEHWRKLVADLPPDWSVPFPAPESWGPAVSGTDHPVVFEVLREEHLPLLKRWAKAKHLKSEFVRHGRPDLRQFFFTDHPTWEQHLVHYLGTPVGVARSEPTASGLKLCLYLGDERYLEQHLSGFLFKLYTLLVAARHPGVRIYVEVPSGHRAIGMVRAAGYRDVNTDGDADRVVMEWVDPATPE